MIRTEFIYNISSIDGVEYFGPAVDLSKDDQTFGKYLTDMIWKVRQAAEADLDQILTVTVRYVQTDIVQPDRYFCLCSCCFHVRDPKEIILRTLIPLFHMDWIVEPAVMEWNSLVDFLEHSP